jgi:hypothetical protein
MENKNETVNADNIEAVDVNREKYHINITYDFMKQLGIRTLVPLSYVLKSEPQISVQKILEHLLQLENIKELSESDMQQLRLTKCFSGIAFRHFGTSTGQLFLLADLHFPHVASELQWPTLLTS